MYCPAEGFRKFYYRSCIVQLKEDRAVCNPALSVCALLRTQHKYHDWNLNERANMYTVTPPLPPKHKLSLVLARLRESLNFVVRFFISRD